MAVGVAGVLVVGRQIPRIMQDIPARRMLPTVWHFLLHGTIDTAG